MRGFHRPATRTSYVKFVSENTGRQCRFLASAFNEICVRASAAIHMLADWPMRFFFRPARPSSSTKPAGNRPSASCCPTRCTSIAARSTALDPLLRVYEGCARAYLGEIDGANLIKLHRHSGKVSYLVYPDFETDPHPALVRSVKLSLRTREIDCLEYAASANPPILHRKETFLAGDHPLYAKFARLTQQEEKHGLLDDTATIGTRDGWNARLGAAGLSLRGHRVVRGG